MKYWIVLTSPAHADISSAVDWYEQRAPETASRFLSQTRNTISRIRKYPNGFQLFRGVVRRPLIPGFPYSIYFFLKPELVFVIALLHHRQSIILRLGGSNGRLRED